MIFFLKFSFPEPLGHFQPNLLQTILWYSGFWFVQMKVHAVFQGEIAKVHWQNFKNLPQNQVPAYFKWKMTMKCPKRHIRRRYNCIYQHPCICIYVFVNVTPPPKKLKKKKKTNALLLYTGEYLPPSSEFKTGWKRLV